MSVRGLMYISSPNNLEYVIRRSKVADQSCFPYGYDYVVLCVSPVVSSTRFFTQNWKCSCSCSFCSFLKLKTYTHPASPLARCHCWSSSRRPRRHLPSANRG